MPWWQIIVLKLSLANDAALYGTVKVRVRYAGLPVQTVSAAPTSSLHTVPVQGRSRAVGQGLESDTLLFVYLKV